MVTAAEATPTPKAKLTPIIKAPRQSSRATIPTKHFVPGESGQGGEAVQSARLCHREKPTASAHAHTPVVVEGSVESSVSVVGSSRVECSVGKGAGGDLPASTGDAGCGGKGNATITATPPPQERAESVPWKTAEDATLLRAKQQQPGIKWKEVSAMLPGAPRRLWTQSRSAACACASPRYLFVPSSPPRFLSPALPRPH